MDIDLYEHNAKTLDDINNYISKNEDCCVVNPCGSGKSAIMAKFIADHPNRSFLIFTKQRNAKDYYFKNYDEILSNSNVRICTYSKMLNDFKKDKLSAYKADFYLIDEAHYIGADKWRTAFLTIKKKHKPRLIGFTATPQRFFDQGTDNTVVSEFFNNNSAGNFTTKDLQKQGLFIEPEYVVSLYNLEAEVMKKLDMIQDADIPEHKKEYYTEKLTEAIKKWHETDSPDKILAKTLPNYMYFKKGNKILVYTANIQDLHKKERMITPIIRKLFKNKKVSVYEYHTKNENALKEFENDDNSYIRILYSIDKIMETIHMDDLNIVIMLRPSVSNRIIVQQYGRINNIKNPNKSLIIDMVGNLDNINSVSFANAITEDGNTTIQSDGTYVNISLKHVIRYNSIFAEIDKVAKKGNRYSYKGYSGSIAKICKAFDKNYSEVKKLMDNGYELNEAIEMAKNNSFIIRDDVMNGYPSLNDFELNDEQRNYIDKATTIAETFIANHGITDDDMSQTLYYIAYEGLSRINPDQMPAYKLTIYLNGLLNNRYLKISQITNRHEQIVDIYDNCWPEIHKKSVYENTDGDPEIYGEMSITHDIMEEVLDTLTNREYKTIALRFGFVCEYNDDPYEKTLDEVSEPFGVTRERTRQVIAKGLRKLRHPSRSRKLKGLLGVGYEDDVKAAKESWDHARTKELKEKITQTKKSSKDEKEEYERLCAIRDGYEIANTEKRKQIAKQFDEDFDQYKKQDKYTLLSKLYKSKKKNDVPLIANVYNAFFNILYFNQVITNDDSWMLQLSVNAIRDGKKGYSDVPADIERRMLKCLKQVIVKDRFENDVYDLLCYITNRVIQETASKTPNNKYYLDDLKIELVHNKDKITSLLYRKLLDLYDEQYHSENYDTRTMYKLVEKFVEDIENT